MSEETNHSDGDKPAVPSNPLFGVWMPMETAPKTDGSIIVFCQANLCSYLVSWDSYRNAWMIFGGFDNELSYEPSAWMLRPPHPPNNNLRKKLD